MTRTWLSRPALLLAVAAVAALLVLTFRVVPVRTDMTAFLPQARSPAGRFMLAELQTGSASRIILAGLEGAPPGDLARLSRDLAERLSRSPAFTLVANGGQALDGPDAAWLFAHRYPLSPATTADAFTPAALHADLARLLAGLQSAASPLLARYGFADPTGAMLALAPAWIGESAVRTVDGVWFAPAQDLEHDRALLLLQTAAPGMDIGAQGAAEAAIEAAFHASAPGPARLLVSGPAVFARAAASAIRSDVRLCSIASAVLVAGLLWWRFRSLAVLLAIAVPLGGSVAVAALTVGAVFGYLHGVALGFGMTMLGVTVDYPVLFIGHRKDGEPASGTLRRIGRAFTLAVLCAAAGLTGMVFTGFPGLAQLGLFAASGVLAAAAITALVLPRLVVAANLLPVWAGDPGGVVRIERWRDHRAWAALPVLLAVAVLLRGGLPWEGDVAALSPVPAGTRALDEALRREIGAPDIGAALVVHAATADAVLQRQEALLPRLPPDMQAAARLLPSEAVQRARLAAIPSVDALQAAVTAAQAGLPFRPDAFAAFVADATAARPVVLEDVTTPALAARLRTLLFERDGAWWGPLALPPGADPAPLRALAGPDALFVDMHAETNALVSAGATRAVAWLAGGAVAALLLLLAGLRSLAMVARIALAIGAATLVTVALLAAAGVRLSMIHLVALQFVAGIGLDYALFYARRGLDMEERARTLRTLVTCNAMTLLTFGLLAFCRTPVLQAIGVTVAIGAVSAMCFSFLLVGQRPDAA